MINRNYLEYLTCGTKAMTRTAIGHSDRQEFAFPCSECGVEIRFAMKLDQSAPSFAYDWIKGAKWIYEPTLPDLENIHYLDGENLIPKDMKGNFSPFIVTSFLPKDPAEYLKERDVRFFASQQVWPKLKALRVHAERKNATLFDKLAGDLHYGGNLDDWQDRLRAELWAIETYGNWFRPFTSSGEAFIRQRINLAESTAASDLQQLVTELTSSHNHQALFAECQRVRDAFAQLYPALSSLYQTFYWREDCGSLDDYQLAEKRFAELKTLYIDCFESFCRISVIAATLEGEIQIGVVAVPKAKGTLTVAQFQAVKNGNKPDVLKNLPLADLFVPFINSKLRNGVGHNSAGYDVKSDEIFYSNHNNKGTTHYRLPYIRFCETIVLIYRQFELVWLYAAWLIARAEGVNGRIM
jgi:hypothetical protein